MKGESFGVVRQASWACFRMGSLAKEHVDRLIAMMRYAADSPRLESAPEIVQAIAAIGPVHENVIPNIVHVLERKKGNWKDGFAALISFGPKAAPAVPAAQYILSKPRGAEPTVNCLKLLAAIGPAAKEAIPDIEKYIDASGIKWQGYIKIKKEEKEAVEKEAAGALAAVTGTKKQQKEE
jgi:hypothetical protein